MRLARTIKTVTSTAHDQRPAAYRPARIALTVVAVIAAMALGLVAGKWQWGRYETKHAAVAAQAAADGAPVVDLLTLMTTDDPGPGPAAWREVTVTGILEREQVVELRGRSVDSTASLQYLTWLHTACGQTVLINLGWAPRSSATALTLPAGEVTVAGIVRAFEADNGKPGTRITPHQMDSIDGEVIQAYVMAQSTCAADACVAGLSAVPMPELSLGPHLSYAMQWWLLTVVAAPLGFWITRRDAQHERERDAEGSEAPAPRARTRTATGGKPRRPTDEEIEDAL